MPQPKTTAARQPKHSRDEDLDAVEMLDDEPVCLGGSVLMPGSGGLTRMNASRIEDLNDF
jgi:hypothetical protein